MKNDFNFCPKCGSKKIENHNNRKWLCPECGFDLYNNVAAAVGIIIRDKYNNVLFEVRAKDPRKGFLALPGGFVDPDETAEQAVTRECIEEIGVKITDVKFLCSNPNTYPYKGIEYKTCDLFFIAELGNEYNSMEDFIKTLKTQESEVQSLVYKKVETIEDVENIPVAFESSRVTLRELVEKENLCRK